MYVWIRIYRLKSECNVACIGSLGNFNAGLVCNVSVLFSVPSCSSASTSSSPSPLGGLNVKSSLFCQYCRPLILMTKESGTPTTLCMMTPCFQTFSNGLRRTPYTAFDSKCTFLVLDRLSSEGCCSATNSGLLLCIIGRFDANV